MKIKNLPKDLQSKVRKYLEYIYEHQQLNNDKESEDNLLYLLSKQLKEDVIIDIIFKKF